MSKVKNLKRILLAIFTLFAFCVFGCKDNNVAVNDISISVENQSDIVLMVDEFFNVAENVSVSPNYATDKSYSIYSMNENVVRVVGNQIKAIAQGETYIRVVSNSNENVEDVLAVVVRDSQSQLETPTMLTYNTAEQMFVFNTVDNASSYTININGDEFDIGNINLFKLSDYPYEKYNKTLAVKVKANAPSYTRAFLESEYSEDLSVDQVLQAGNKIYQTSSVDNLKVNGGILSFDVEENLVYDVYLNNERYKENLSIAELSLLTLEDKYCGETLKLYIQAKPSEESMLENGADVAYVPSKSNELTLKVLVEQQPKIVNTVLTWENVTYSAGYDIYLNGEKVAETENNYFDLSTLSAYNLIENTNQNSIYVSSKMASTSENVAKSLKINPVTFVKLSQPVLSLSGDVINWQVVENAASYHVELKQNGTVKFDGNTTNNYFDLTNFSAGNYEVTVSANGIAGGAENYISSKASNKTFVKSGEVVAEIKDYVLTASVENGKKYSISFDIDDSNSYNNQIVANGNQINIDLSTYNFKAGEHNLTIKRVGSGNEVNSEIKQLTFVQLEPATITISNSQAVVNRSAINTNATIYMEISGGDLTEPKTVYADNYGINTIDSSVEYFAAGNYEIVAYVCGDGSSTFSHRNLKQEIPCGNISFKVLDVPTLSVVDFSKPEVLVNVVNDAVNYTILDANNLPVASVDDKYAFTIESDAIKTFKVIANGNGNSVLSSLVSEEIIVQRLATPDLSFDWTDNSIGSSFNTANEKCGVKFTFEGLESDYTFGEEFTGLKIGDNNFAIQLISKGKVGGINYINSLPGEIVVCKLSNETNNEIVSINSNNQLRIGRLKDRSGELKLKFGFDSTEYSLITSGIIAGLGYNVTAEDYVINLLDNNYNAIIDEIANKFSVSFKYSSTRFEVVDGIKKYYACSDWTLPVELELNRLNAATKIYTNTNNKIIVENPNNEKLYLDLQISIGGELILLQDNGLNQLVGEGYIINYNYSENKYAIDLYSNGNIKIEEINQGDNFDVSVKFRKTLNGSDIDSNYSSKTNLKYLQSSVLERNGQTLSLVTAYENYNLDKYQILVNGEIVALSEMSSVFELSTIGELNKFTANVVDLFTVLKTKISGFDAENINELAIEILNSATTEDIPLLGCVGGSIYVQQAEAFEIRTVKTNGVTSVQFETEQSEYSKTYSINVTNTEYANENSTISVSVEDLNFEESFAISGFVKTTGNYTYGGRLIQVFNSQSTNIITITRLSSPVLSVENDYIIYTNVSGATEYEIYKKSTTSDYEKVDEAYIERNGSSFRFNNLAETEEFKVVVKAKTSNNTVLNSNLSEQITVKKIGVASTSVQGGILKLVLPNGCKELIESGDVKAAVNLVIDGSTYRCLISQDLTTSQADVNWDASSNSFNIATSKVFNRAAEYIKENKIQTTLELNGKYNNIYYVYSNENTSKVKCLFAPTNIGVDKTDINAEKISWSNNAKNKLSPSGELLNVSEYVLKIEHNGKIYYSFDAGLKYKNVGNYVSYLGIPSTSVAFPYGYDANNDGDFADENDVVFKSGDYYISVAAVLDGYLYSLYSERYYFAILEKPVVNAVEGSLAWNRVEGAEKYIIRIKSETGVELQKETTLLTYNFEDFVKEGLYSVAVQAITTQTNLLNSKESEETAIWRMAQATNIGFEDGKIEFLASKFINEIAIELGGKTYSVTNMLQTEYLAEVVSVEELTDLTNNVWFIFDLTKYNPDLAGVSGKIKVTLNGNTGLKKVGTGAKEIAFINSKTTEHQTAAVVLDTNVNTVTAGVWKFEQNSNLGTTEKVDINYEFNSVTNLNSFWENAIVYQINIDTYGQGEVKNDVIYAVDYYRFIDGGLSMNTASQTYYELCDGLNGLYARVIYVDINSNKLYFNVYKDNIIDLQNYDNLYYYSLKEESPFVYVSDSDIKSIDLAAGGSFVVSIITLGGDEKLGSSYSCLNSPLYELAPFTRYGQNSLSTKGGQLVFTNLNNYAAILPVYKVSISNWNDDNFTYVYIYDSKTCTEADVRDKFKLSADDICEPMIYIEETNQIAFEMGEYFGAGVYATYVRAMAGIGADDFLLNAKVPENPYVVKVLTATNPKLNKGNLTFDLAYVNADGTFDYSYDYEIIVKHDGLEYIQQINVNSENVLIEGTKLTYTLPNQIDKLSLVSGENYELKVRALTNKEGVLNAPFYDGNLDGSEDLLAFTKQTPVSDVKIEDGILKWIGSADASNYEIKINYYNSGYKTIKITDGYIKSDENYKYEFTEKEYDIVGEAIKTQILPDVNYTISVSRLGNNENVISSSYTSCENNYRLSNVISSQILANQGKLTWLNVADAVGYKLEMVGSKTYTFTTNTNSIDFVSVKSDNEEILPAGEYVAKIKALGSGKINSMLSTSNLTFTKLSKVTNVQILGESITWDDVGAVGYVIEFSYNGKTNTETVYKNSVDIPNDVEGILTAKITAYGGDSTTLLNSDTVEVQTSNETPNSVTGLTYNNELNRFEWKVSSNFVNTDSLLVKYDLIEYSASGNIEHETESIEISFKQNGYYDETNDVYYIPITVMGVYNNFSVCVQRPNAVNSPSVSINENVKLFNYGGGTSENPYVLDSEQSLLNIKYYPNSYYKLINNIDITGTYSSAIIQKEFGGIILGSNCTINLGEVNLANVKEYALFKALNNAEIYNLDIKGNIINAISLIEEDVNIAILAVNANSVVLENVRVLNSNISIVESEQNSTKEINADLYLAGLICKDENSQIESCSVIITTNIDVDVNDVYVAGSISKASKTMINEGKVNVTLTSTKNTIKYFGGVVAYYVGNPESRNIGIVGVEVELMLSNIKTLYFGGVCGYAKYALLENNTVKGDVSRLAVTGDIFFGGMAGIASSCLVYNNNVIANITITIQTIAGTQRIGKVVGSMEIDGNTSLSSELKGSYSSDKDQTSLVTNNPLNLGLVGYKATGVIVDKNYTT